MISLLHDHFDETNFLTLGRGKSQPNECCEILWITSSLAHLDQCTSQCELEVQKIVHLQRVANELLDAFTNSKVVNKFHVTVINSPAKIDVLKREFTKSANELRVQLKGGWHVGVKDKNPRKRKKQVTIIDHPFKL